MGRRGNKGSYFGAPLELLQKHLPAYLAAPDGNKTNFWSDFWPDWDGAYPALDSDELRQELADLEIEYNEETEGVKSRNKAAIKKKTRRTAKLEKLPATSARLDELRARGSSHEVCSSGLWLTVSLTEILVLQKVKRWFSYAKTKDKNRKTEPFRAWLGRLATVHHKPRRLHLPWLLWQHEKQGQALRALYRQKYNADTDEEGVDEDGDGEDGEDGEDGGDEQDDDEKQVGAKGRSEMLNRRYALGKAFFDGLTQEEQEEMQELRENQFKERLAAFERAAQGDATSTPDELAE
jgi:hypothetical protein